MSNKEAREFYHSLSRKELQSSCKKYGLPARKSSSEMAESLFSFFQKKDLSLISSDKSIGEIQEVLRPPSSVTTLQAEIPFRLTGNMIKDNIHLRPCSREERNKGNKNIKCNELESCMELRTYDKQGFGGSVDYFLGASQSQFVSQRATIGFTHEEPPSSLSGRVEDTSRFLCADSKVGVCPKENASTAIKPCSKVSSSFEFYVSSEEGIKLSVDLNSSPADWIKNYKNQVSLCNNMGNSKSRSLHQELGRIGESNIQMKSSFPQSMDTGEIKDGHIQTKSSPSLVIEKNNIEIDHPAGGNQSSILSPTIPCSVVVLEASDCLGEDQGPISSKPSSDVQNQIISTMESCSKNGYGVALDSDITDPPTENTACNYAINSISDGSIDIVAIEHQNSKHDVESCENLTLQTSSNLENNYVAFSGCLASCSTDMQLSETGNCHKDAYENGKFLALDDSKHHIGTEQAVLATSSENDPCGNHLPLCSDELEWSNIVNGMESSVCSQVDNSVDKTCLNSDNLEPNEASHKKRSLMDSEGQDSCGKRDGKILRSMKHSAAEITPRRSMRLVSK